MDGVMTSGYKWAVCLFKRNFHLQKRMCRDGRFDSRQICQAAIKRGQQQRIRFLYSERIYIPRIYSFASLQGTFRQQLYFFVYIYEKMQYSTLHFSSSNIQQLALAMHSFFSGPITFFLITKKLKTFLIDIICCAQTTRTAIYTAKDLNHIFLIKLGC